MTDGDAATRLIEVLDELVGDELRGVVMFTPETAEVAYLRDDLQGVVNLHDFEPTIDQARELNETLYRVGELQGGTLGRPAGNVAVFEHSIVVVLAYEPAGGVVVTLEHTAEISLSGFVKECVAALYDEPPATRQLDPRNQ